MYSCRNHPARSCILQKLEQNGMHPVAGVSTENVVLQRGQVRTEPLLPGRFSPDCVLTVGESSMVGTWGEGVFVLHHSTARYYNTNTRVFPEIERLNGNTSCFRLLLRESRLVF